MKCHALALEPDDRLRDAGALAERFSSYLESVESRLRQSEVDRATETARAEEALKTAAEALVSRQEAQGRVVDSRSICWSELYNCSLERESGFRRFKPVYLDISSFKAFSKFFVLVDSKRSN